MTGAAEYLDKELEVLHRSVRAINNELMEIESDQKHISQLLEDLGLTQSIIVKTPRVKLSVIEAEPIENSPILEGAQATTSRSGTMRCAYLAQDRADSSEAVKCLARALSKPKAGHMTQLQRVARFVKGVPRKALQQPSQEPSRAHLEAGLESLCGEDYICSDTALTVQSAIGLSSAEPVEGRKIAMDAYCGLNSAQWSRVDSGQDEEPAGIIEPSGVVVVGTSQRERRIRITS